MFLVLNLGALFLLARNDHLMIKVLGASFILKLIASCVAVWLVRSVFHGGDMLMYYDYGSAYATSLASDGHFLPLDPIWGTNFVVRIASLVMALIGPSLLATSAIFGIMSLWGQYLYVRTFTLAFPEGQTRKATVLLMLFPSLLFWSAALGKDALAMLSIAVVAYGFVTLANRNRFCGLPVIAAGLLVTGLVRPHIAAILAVSVATGFFFSRHVKGTKALLSTMALVPLLAVVALFTVSLAGDALKVDSQQAAFDLSDRAYESNQSGDSGFGQDTSVATRLLLAPLLFFRPFPWEVRTVLAALSCTEGMIICLLIVRNRRQIAHAVAHASTNPFLVFASVSLFLFTIMLGYGSSNFGLLVRQRVTALPFLFVLLCQPLLARDAVRLRG